MKRKASSILLIGLCVILAGLMSYTVYSTLTASLNFANTISFNSEGIYYKATCSVKYANASTSIINPATLDKDGIGTDSLTDEINFSNEDIVFKNDSAHKTIIYTIEITNCSLFDINARIVFNNYATMSIIGIDEHNNPTSDEVRIVKNTLSNSSTTLKIDGYDDSDLNNIHYNSKTFTLSATCINFTRSFENISNNFSFTLEEIGEAPV